MSSLYLIKADGQTMPMNRIRCKDEERELQDLLEVNPQLMPGDQIKPDDPRRWLLIKREMPVPDPSSGEDRWSIDHFFVDQSAIPTFVECKRFLDTRSRREVLGQMLDYAANGHWYWDRETIRDLATRTATEQGVGLEDALSKLSPDIEGGVDDFLEQVENNLREGQIRMIFFMEEAPQELKSIVDFLNKQMERSEILIVEAKQFESSGMKVVVPALFGYTEQSRRIKKTVSVSSGKKLKKWDENLFFQDSRNKLTPAQVESLQQLYEFFKSRFLTIKWGGGNEKGSINFYAEKICPRSIIGVNSNGNLWLNFGYITGSPIANSFREKMADAMRSSVGLDFPLDIDSKYPGFRIDEWSSKVSLILKVMDSLLTTKKDGF